MLYSPFTALLEKTRLLFQRRVKDGQLAVLGDSDGTGARTEVPDADGYVYARFPGTPDASGNATYSAPFLVRSGNAAFQNYPGASVYVAYGYNNELEIVSGNYQEMTRSGIDTRTLNPLHQQSKWVYLWQLTIGLCSAVTTAVTGSLLVTVKKYRHYVNNRFQTFETGLQAVKIDLASYVPAADMHRYAAVWIDTYTNTAEVTASTTQSMFTPLDATDIQELVTSRPPDAIPHKAFYLSNAQTSVSQNAAADVDLRQFLNTPPVHGLPYTVEYRERIQPDRQGVFVGSMIVTGSLIVLGSLVSVPINTSDATGGGGGGMTSFDVAADTGTPATITDGDTLTFTGGDGIATSVSGDTVTTEVDSTVARLTAIQTLDNKTLTTPTIASFTNAQHNHTNAAGGGQITDAALSAAVGIAKGGTGQTTQTAAFDALAPTTTKGDMIAHNGTDNVRLAVGSNGQILTPDSSDAEGLIWSGPLVHARHGLEVRAINTDLSTGSNATTILLTQGFYWLRGKYIAINEPMLIDVTTAGNWIGGSSLESNSEFIKVYGDESGNIRLSDKWANYTYPDTSNRKTTGQINEMGWNGTTALGLDAATIDVDNLSTALDTSMNGMLALVYTDSGYTTGRSRGSAASGSVDDLSAMLIMTADNAFPRLYTYNSHNIAINNNDYFIIVPNGPIEYMEVSGSWYRLLGAIYNNSSGDLEGRRLDYRAMHQLSASASIASTTFADIDGTNLNFRILSTGTDIDVFFAGSLAGSAATTGVKFGVLVDLDANSIPTTHGFQGTLPTGNTTTGFAWQRKLRLIPGTHLIKPQWAAVAAGTARIVVAESLGGITWDMNPRFWVERNH